jgi:hypothetical protein
VSVSEFMELHGRTSCTTTCNANVPKESIESKLDDDLVFHDEGCMPNSGDEFDD